MMTPDWNLIRAFRATAATGSLSKAAVTLGLTQPTLSRQIAALEGALGVTLFDRIGKRLVMTGAARELVGHVEAMAAAAEAMALAAAGRSREVSGRVTISASDSVAAWLLPELIPAIRAAAPQVTLVVAASNEVSDLRRREADIAIRHVRPTEPELIATLARETEAHLYASEAWVAANGAPRGFGDLKDGRLLAYDPTGRFVDYLAGVGAGLGDADFRLASESSLVLWQMARRGLGACFMLRDVAERTPGMVRLLPDLPGCRRRSGSSATAS